MKPYQANLRMLRSIKALALGSTAVIGADEMSLLKGLHKDLGAAWTNLRKYNALEKLNPKATKVLDEARDSLQGLMQDVNSLRGVGR